MPSFKRKLTREAVVDRGGHDMKHSGDVVFCKARSSIHMSSPKSLHHRNPNNDAMTSLQTKLEPLSTYL